MDPEDIYRNPLRIIPNEIVESDKKSECLCFYFFKILFSRN